MLESLKRGEQKKFPIRISQLRNSIPHMQILQESQHYFMRNIACIISYYFLRIGPFNFRYTHCKAY